MANLTVPIKVEIMNAIGVIRFLLDEIEEERRYNEAHEVEMNRAIKQAEKEGGYYYNYFDYNKFPHAPRQSIINENIKMIRRLSLKISKS